MIVVDSNVLAARNLSSVATPWARQVEALDALWIVPPLWRYEYQNILAKALWTGHITLSDAVAAWQKAADQLADNEQEPSPKRVLELSKTYRITGYDANFIALAIETEVRCVTEDRELHEKFPAIALSMEDFVIQSKGDSEVREMRASYRTRRRTRPL